MKKLLIPITLLLLAGCINIGSKTQRQWFMLNLKTPTSQTAKISIEKVFAQEPYDSRSLIIKQSATGILPTYNSQFAVTPRLQIKNILKEHYTGADTNLELSYTLVELSGDNNQAVVRSFVELKNKTTTLFSKRFSQSKKYETGSNYNTLVEAWSDLLNQQLDEIDQLIKTNTP